jgi:hypothetical protein
MSSATKPLGMNSMPASGYNHKSTTYNKQYVTWKGSGINSNPVGTASGHIRPLTNNDPGNVFQTGFGLPRPIKHFRKGRVIVAYPIEEGNLSYNNISCVCSSGSRPYPDGAIHQNKTTTTVDISPNEAALINYNINRFVKSSKGTSLGGGFGGSGLLNDLQDKPGAFIVKQTVDSSGNIADLQQDCKTCEGVGIIVDYYPNRNYLTQNPKPVSTNISSNPPAFCCNEEYKAKRRAIYASTNLKKNYYTSTKQYLQNRCKTYDQKAFNFLSYRTNTTGPYQDNNPYYAVRNAGPTAGSPETQKASFLDTNLYFANCQPGSQIYDATQVALIDQMFAIMIQANILTTGDQTAFNATGLNSIEGFYNWLNSTLTGTTKTNAINVFNDFIRNPYWGMPLSGPSNPAGCQLTVYKPNNYQFAQQGAVSSSTRNLKLNVDTISTNAASINNYNNTGNLVSANQLYAGVDPNLINLQKNKAPGCNTPWPLNFSQSGPFQNKKFCYYKKLPQYQVPVSQPSGVNPIYIPGTVFSSNHFSQSPNTYNTTSGTAAYR